MFKEKLLLDALRLYAGQHVLDRVLHQGREALAYTSQRQVMTLMFLDMQGMFPDEALPLKPESLRPWLLGWHTLISRCIGEFRGTLDSFIGDAVIAHWNMLPQTDHAALALSCAERLVASINDHSAAQVAKGLPGMRRLIGIHSGMVDLGNHGTLERMRYSVMGDTVNLASRLCGRCSQYGVATLLTDSCLVLAGNAVATSAVDTIRVKGNDKPVKIYTLGSAYIPPPKPAWSAAG
jgi:adenylate cyclase